MAEPLICRNIGMLPLNLCLASSFNHLGVERRARRLGIGLERRESRVKAGTLVTS